MTDRMTGALPDERVSDREALCVLALLAGMVALAGPRRTRPLAGFLYGLALSRAHGASRRHLELAALAGGRLHAEHRMRLGQLETRRTAHGKRLDDLELIVAHDGPTGRALLDERVSSAHGRVRARVPGFDRLRGLTEALRR